MEYYINEYYNYAHRLKMKVVVSDMATKQPFNRLNPLPPLTASSGADTTCGSIASACLPKSPLARRRELLTAPDETEREKLRQDLEEKVLRWRERLSL